tara:strand:- start:1058 stop:1306 length:249 start_codon:yes stop_codon:yes gene_type:complete
MPGSLEYEYPVRDYGIKIFIKPLHAIDLSVVCDETEIGNRAREHSDYIIAEVVDQVKKQLEDIELGSGIAVVEKRPANWMDV